MKNVSKILMFIFIGGLLSAALFLNSCSKEELKTEKEETSNNVILEFKDENELQKTLKEVNTMTSLEFANWETGKNFKSLKTKLDYIYRQLNNEELVKTEAAVYKILDENIKWIELITDETGERCAYPKWFSNNKL